ncbi:MAG: hypothetical protein M3N39_02005, partial [Pseudomonadota bacterium]|nr:hypothetical protein [Pseudomonadota bacterium]
MRTLASTFSTREEAEAARRHLESIGIARERIILKDVAPAAGGAAASGSEGAGSTGRAFLSVKVTTDQVERASEILKGRWQAEHKAAAPDVGGRPLGNVQDAVAGASVPPWPLPAQDTGLAPGSPRQDSAAPLGPGQARRAAHDHARRSRYVIFFLL